VELNDSIVDPVFSSTTVDQRGLPIELVIAERLVVVSEIEGMFPVVNVEGFDRIDVLHRIEAGYDNMPCTFLVVSTKSLFV
jgi:hypothetical protein